MANFALNYSFSRNLNIPLDEDAVKATLAEVRNYVETKGKCYAGQLFSVTGDTGNNGLYIVLTTGVDGIIVKLASQDALDAVAASAGKIDEIRLNGSALTINNKVVNIDLSTYSTIEYVDGVATNTLKDAKAYVDGKLVDFATKSFVTEQIVSAMTGGEIELTGYAKEEEVKAWDAEAIASAKSYTDSAITASEEKLLWIPVEGDTEKHVVRHWKGSRANYEFLVKNNAVNAWTRYVVIDSIAGVDSITEYYGVNQITELTGQLLPANSIIGSISEISNPTPYDRFLVGADGTGYNVYEYVIDSEGAHKWIIKPFDYRFGIRIKDKGLKNYIYVDNTLRTYDDVDCGMY